MIIITVYNNNGITLVKWNNSCSQSFHYILLHSYNALEYYYILCAAVYNIMGINLIYSFVITCTHVYAHAGRHTHAYLCIFIHTYTHTYILKYIHT